MARSGSALVALFVVAAFLGTSPRACRADGYVNLTAGQDADGFSLGFHADCEWTWDPWSLALTLTLPEPLTSEDEESVDLAVTWDGEGWRWTMVAGYDRSPTRTKPQLQLRGAFSSSPWSGSATLYRDGDETGLRGYVACKLDRQWRASLSQGIAHVTGGDEYLRYEAEAGLTWRGEGRRFGLAVGGTAHRHELALDDERWLHAALSGSAELAGDWSFEGALRLTQHEDGQSQEIGGKLSLAWIRWTPCGLKLQAEYGGEDGDAWVRGGVTLTGARDRFFWRVGVAGEQSLYDDDWALWPYAVAGWRGDAWRVTLGLTPDGEYATNSRQAYWLTVAYAF